VEVGTYRRIWRSWRRAAKQHDTRFLDMHPHRQVGVYVDAEIADGVHWSDVDAVNQHSSGWKLMLRRLVAHHRTSVLSGLSCSLGAYLISSRSQCHLISTFRELRWKCIHSSRRTRDTCVSVIRANNSIVFTNCTSNNAKLRCCDHIMEHEASVLTKTIINEKVKTESKSYASCLTVFQSTPLHCGMSNVI